MNILINLSTLKKGGGQNVALNFVECLNRLDNDSINFYFMVVKNSELHRYLERGSKNKLIFMPHNPILRILKEYFFGGVLIRKNKIDIIYTYFGVGLFPKDICQISGSADSNIYFPEVDFWSEYTGFSKWKRKVIDKYRIWGLKRMTAIIFENQIMEIRGGKLFNIANSIFIKPSINTNYENRKLLLPKNVSSETPKGLFFCGWQRNKNFMAIPLIAAELERRKINFHFLFTANADNSLEYFEFKSLVMKYNVDHMISLIGSVKKDQIRSLYDQVDIVFLLSKLESFSNNIIESWNFKKPLIISEGAWSRSICKEAAVYVDRDNISDIVNEIIKLQNDDGYKAQLVSLGSQMLSTYPTIEERTKQELDYLKVIYEND